MAEKWYPVIDYSLCIECGTCSAFCSHGVYDQTKSPTPVVVYPLGCVDHCHGCQKKCPVGAISYVGDTESGNEKEGSSCACGCQGE